MTDGNHIRVLKNGDQIFPAMLEAIEQAQQSIVFLTYVYWKGAIADDFAYALAKKAQQGVEVSVLIDAFGGNKIDTALVRHMQAAGVEVRWFRPLRWYSLHTYNNRTHRKILVCDNQVGFVGGVGIADEWTGDAQDEQHWRDTHFSIQGPAVAELLDSFNENWQEAGGRAVHAEWPGSVEAGGVSVQIISSTHGGKRTEGHKLFYSAITSAKEDIMITTAYFVPNRHFIRALNAAARRGVTVTILTNGPNSNHYIARKAGHYIYSRLLYGGVKIYEYQKTLLHAKVMTVDHRTAIIGSSNFDDRSFVHNDEVCVSFRDPAVVAQLDEQYEQDMASAVQITLGPWLARARRSKLAERLSALLARQL